MYEQFLDQGSVLAVILMVYAGNVMIEALRRDKLDSSGMHTPLIIKHPVSSLFMFLAIPCAIWPAVYIGIYEGLVAGIVAWIALQIAGAIGTMALGVRGPALGFHFLAACVAYPIGYYLSLTNFPA